MKIKVLLFGTKESCAQLQLRLRDDEIAVVGSVTDENSVLDQISHTVPDLILITDSSAMALRACQQIYLLRPRCVPVVISDTAEVPFQKIMQAGVHYVLPPDMEPLLFISELKGIFNNEANRILTLESTGASSNKSKVILVFSAKDGVGKSTLAVNLAVKLAQRKNKVVVLDYDYQFGDVGSLFGSGYKSTILELVQEQVNPNVDTIRQFLSMHVSGVSFLPSPHEPEYADSITPMQAERIIESLRIYYDYVIVDICSGFNDMVASCIDCASQILFITEKNIPALKNAKKGLDVLQALSYGEKVKLIITREENSSIKDSDVARVLGIPVWHKIPGDTISVTASADLGNPLVLEHPRSKVSEAIIEMCKKIDSPSIPTDGNPGRKKRFGRERKGNRA